MTDMNEEPQLLGDDQIIHKMHTIRGFNVLLDRDLARMYGVETKRLKEQVRRNISRFPADFMFELSKNELMNWRSHYATSNPDIMGLRHAPFAFTEHGILMLSSVLNSERAIQVNIQIMRIYVRLKNVISLNNELWLKLLEVENELSDHRLSIKQLFSFINDLVRTQSEPRKVIGFKKD
jgi:ORF6N domain